MVGLALDIVSRDLVKIPCPRPTCKGKAEVIKGYAIQCEVYSFSCPVCHRKVNRNPEKYLDDYNTHVDRFIVAK
jgi:hypothetical protein